MTEKENKKVTDYLKTKGIHYYPTINVGGLNIHVADMLYGFAKQENEKSAALIKAQEEYIKILGEELNGVVGLAAVHGWESTRFEAGKIAREKIEGLKAELSND